MKVDVKNLIKNSKQKYNSKTNYILFHDGDIIKRKVISP